MFPITTFDSFEQMLWLNTLNHFLVLKCQLKFLLPELAADSITSVWKHLPDEGASVNFREFVEQTIGRTDFTFHLKIIYFSFLTTQ